MALHTSDEAPNLLDIHRRKPTSIIGYPLEDVVTVQMMQSHESTLTAMNGLLSVVDVLTASQTRGTPDDYVGTGILYHSVMNPMQVATVEGHTHEESIRFMLLDIRDFANFIANRHNTQKRNTKWSPAFHTDSTIYTANILPPIDLPESYQENQWSVLRYPTVVPGIYLEVAEELGVSVDGHWIFPNGTHFQYVLNEDELV